MRNLVITENTLDGVIDTGNDWFARGLADEYWLFVYPIVIGHGARLFETWANVGS